MKPQQQRLSQQQILNHQQPAGAGAIGVQMNPPPYGRSQQQQSYVGMVNSPATATSGAYNSPGQQMSGGLGGSSGGGGKPGGMHSQQQIRPIPQQQQMRGMLLFF